MIRCEKYWKDKNVSPTGLTEAASALQKEANLPKCSTPPPLLPSAASHIYSPVTPKIVSNLGIFVFINNCD